MEI
ncbi:unnamed protein product [Lasius platythorax]|jgi:hypothetical protein